MTLFLGWTKMLSGRPQVLLSLFNGHTLCCCIVTLQFYLYLGDHKILGMFIQAVPLTNNVLSTLTTEF